MINVSETQATDMLIRQKCLLGQLTAAVFMLCFKRTYRQKRDNS